MKKYLAILPLLLAVLMLAGCGETNRSAHDIPVTGTESSSEDSIDGDNSADGDTSGTVTPSPEPSKEPVIIPNAEPSKEPKPSPEPFAPVKLSPDEALTLDLNGDGSEETVCLRLMKGDEGERYELHVQSDDMVYAGSTDIIWDCALWAADTDTDGRVELYVSGDVMSDDYMSYVWRYDGGLIEVGVRDNSGLNRRSGRITEIDGEFITVSDYINVLGSYWGSQSYTLVNGELAPAESGVWTLEDNEFTLKTLLPLPVLMDDGATELPAGTELRLTAYDEAAGRVWFATSDDERGYLTVESNADGFGYSIGGTDEYDCFETLPYAG